MKMLKKLVKKPLFPICPTSGKLLGWRLFQAFSVHVTLLLVGYQAAFDASINTWHYLFIYLGDFTYLINTVLYFLTAIKNKGKVNRDRDVIVKKNLNFYFVVDVISLLPLEIFGLASSSVLFTAALLRLNRVLRIIRITQFFSKWYIVCCIREYYVCGKQLRHASVNSPANGSCTIQLISLFLKNQYLP